MKKFTYLSLTLCMFLFLGCNDDDDNNKKEGISKEYTGRYLAMKLNTADFYDGAVDLNTTDATKANFALKYLLPGERNIIVSSVPLKQDEENKTLYHFTGESKNANREITFTGTADGENMVIDTDFKIVSSVVKRRTVQGTPALALNIIPSSEDAKMNMYGVGGKLNQEVKVEDGCKALSNLASTMFMLAIDLKLDTKEDGNFILMWKGKLFGKDLIPEGQLEDGIVKYNLTDEQIYLTMNLESLLSNLTSGGGLPEGMTIEELLALYTGMVQGIPVDYEFDEKGFLKLTIRKEILEPYLKVLMPLLMDVLVDADIPNIMEMLPKEGLLKFLPEFMQAIEESKDFNIVLSLK